VQTRDPGFGEANQDPASAVHHSLRSRCTARGERRHERNASL